MRVAITLLGAVCLVAAVAGVARLRSENDRLASRVAELERSTASQGDAEVTLAAGVYRSNAAPNFDALETRAEKAEARADELMTLNAKLWQRIDARPNVEEAKKAALGRKQKRKNKVSSENDARISEAKRVFGAVEMERETQRRYGAFLSTLDASNSEEARLALSELLSSSKWGEDNFDDRVHDVMAGVLSAEELEAFTRYEDELPEAMMRQEYDQDIALLAPELGLDSRNLVVDALIGDMLYATDGIAEGDDLGRITTMVESMYGTRESLAELLSADELAAATRYLDIRITMLEAKLPFVEAEAGGSPKTAAS